MVGSGCGQGNISWILYQTLLEKIPDSQHILNKMLFMLELNEEIDIERNLKAKINYISTNFIFINHHINLMLLFVILLLILENIKTPTNTNQDKKEDGFNSWCDFVNKALELLEDDGYMCFIVPALWLKPDKAKIYERLLNISCMPLKVFQRPKLILF